VRIEHNQEEDGAEEKTTHANEKYSHVFASGLFSGFDPDNAIGRGHGFHRQQGGQGVEQGIRVMHIQVA